MTLEEISKKYKTDKGNVYHGYLDIYENYFNSIREREVNLLEIGINEGESLKLWSDYFTFVKIDAFDIFDCSKFDSEYIKTYVIDQSSEVQLQDFISNNTTEYDIIIDDGGHMMHQQQISLAKLFKLLKSGGIYVIEDLHTCRNPSYNRGNDISTLEILNNIQNGFVNSNVINEEDSKFLLKNIKECNIEYGRVSEICFLRKK